MRLSIVRTATALMLFAGAASAEVRTIPEQLFNDLSRDTRLQDFQIHAITANFARETGNFQFLQELKPLSGRGGLGYAQWTGKRRIAFESWANEHELDVTSYEANYGFLMVELNGPYANVLARLERTETMEEAVRLFMRRYLAPHPDYAHYNERLAYAVSYSQGDYSGAGCQSHHEVSTDQGMLRVKLCPEAEFENDWALGIELGSQAIASDISFDRYREFADLPQTFDRAPDAPVLSFSTQLSEMDVFSDADQIVITSGPYDYALNDVPRADPDELPSPS